MGSRSPDQLRAPSTNSRHYGEQDENGVDLSLIRENLLRTPTDRVWRQTARGAILRSCWSMASETEKSALERVAEILLTHNVEFIVIGVQA